MKTIYVFTGDEMKELDRHKGCLSDIAFKPEQFKRNSMIQLTEEQRKQLGKLWFTYGNNGKKHTHHNHRFIQNILEHGEDTEEFYRTADMERSKSAGICPATTCLTDECVAAVRQILENR